MFHSSFRLKKNGILCNIRIVIFSAYMKCAVFVANRTKATVIPGSTKDVFLGGFWTLEAKWRRWCVADYGRLLHDILCGMLSNDRLLEHRYPNTDAELAQWLLDTRTDA